MSLKSRVEAILFLTDKPMAAAAIAQLVNTDVQEVRQAILELIHDYEERNSALEIADDGGYMMQAKDEYATFASEMAPIDLPVSVVRTLSAIAIKQPVLQSEIVRIRGAGAYDHVKELLEKELITKKEEGRSSLLGTTKKFQEYFRLSQDARTLRDQLKEQTKGSETEPKIEIGIETEAGLIVEATTAIGAEVETEIAAEAEIATETDFTAEPETETATEADFTAEAEPEADIETTTKSKNTITEGDIAMLAGNNEFAPNSTPQY